MRRVMMVCLLLAFAGVAGANLLTNPSFETQQGADSWLAEGWWRDNTGSFADMVDRNNWHPNTGTWDMLIKGWQVGQSGRFGQYLSADVALNDVVTFSIWGDAEADFAANNLYLGIEFYHASGVSTQMMSIYSDFTSQLGSYHQYTFVSTAQVSGVYALSAFVFADTMTAASGSRSVYFDDGDLTVIPEPTVAGLLGIGGLLVCAVRRKIRG